MMLEHVITKSDWGERFRRGASIACFTLFSLAPTLLLVIAIARLVLGRDAAEGAVVLLLLWIFYSTPIFLLGAEFTRAWTRVYGARRRDPESRPR